MSKVSSIDEVLAILLGLPHVEPTFARPTSPYYYHGTMVLAILGPPLIGPPHHITSIVDTMVVAILGPPHVGPTSVKAEVPKPYY